MKVHYINLSSGAAWIPEFQRFELPENPTPLDELKKLSQLLDPLNLKVVRIQSTWCEQKLWGNILQDLDYSFLLDLALGREVHIYDTSARKETSRALYQGVPWIRYTLTKLWLKKEIPAEVRGQDVSKYFAQMYHLHVCQDKNLKTRLKYVKKFIDPNLKNLSLTAHSFQSSLDGNYEEIGKLLRKI